MLMIYFAPFAVLCETLCGPLRLKDLNAENRGEHAENSRGLCMVTKPNRFRKPVRFGSTFVKLCAKTLCNFVLLLFNELIST